MVYILPTFRGYTVDARLRQFRKLVFGQMPEFIEFDSPKGQRLLKAMGKFIVDGERLRANLDRAVRPEPEA